MTAATLDPGEVHRPRAWHNTTLEDAMKCPACNVQLGAITGKPHCKSKTCTWTDCKCGATVDRNTSSFFGGK